LGLLCLVIISRDNVMFVQLYTINSTNLGGNRIRGGSKIFPITQGGPDWKRLGTAGLSSHLGFTIVSNRGCLYALFCILWIQTSSQHVHRYKMISTICTVYLIWQKNKAALRMLYYKSLYWTRRHFLKEGKYFLKCQDFSMNTKGLFLSNIFHKCV